MSIFGKHMGALVLGVAGLLSATAQPLRAQTRQILTAQQQFPINPYWQVRPGLSQSQYLYNFTARAQALQQMPPWAYGYNPYPPTIYQQNSSPTYGYPYSYGYPSWNGGFPRFFGY
jgi:hypothetical protein